MPANALRRQRIQHLRDFIDWFESGRSSRGRSAVAGTRERLRRSPTSGPHRSSAKSDIQLKRPNQIMFCQKHGFQSNLNYLGVTAPTSSYFFDGGWLSQCLRLQAPPPEVIAMLAGMRASRVRLSSTRIGVPPLRAAGPGPPAPRAANPPIDARDRLVSPFPTKSRENSYRCRHTHRHRETVNHTGFT